MIGLNLDHDRSGPLKILCLGAHCDDIEIGCGGTLLKLLSAHPEAEVLWVVFCSTEERAQEARRCAEEFLKGSSRKRIQVFGYRDGFLPYDGAGVKEHFEALKKEFDPHIIFTHYLQDRHQDHRLISDLTWNTWRNHLILEYEIPKYDGDLGSPNVFVDLGETLCAAKVESIMRCYKSQRSKHWFEKELFLGLARVRGLESASKSAEAFYCRKVLLQW
jgi:LmbE family N-acetylglucosaminyl deacetylase